MSKLNKIAIITSLVGLAVIVIVIISGSSYPDPFFSYGTAIEMLMIFLLVLLALTSATYKIFCNILDV